MSQDISLNDLLSEIQERASGHGKYVIALSGFGGSGKSTLADKMAEQLENAVVIRLDDFIIDRLSKRSEDWEGIDWDRLTKQVLQPILEGADVLEYGVYDWKENAVTNVKKIVLKKYVIIEGIGLIRENLKKYFDLTVWLDVPLEIASRRGKQRDVEEYGLPHYTDLWDSIWIPNDRDYFAKYQPDVHADLLLANQ